MNRPDNNNETAPPRWVPYAVFAVLTAILAYPILKDIHNWGVRDWDLFTTLHAAAVKSIVEYGQFPFWNPYIGGGNILFAHPEVPVLNPFFLLMLAFGPLVGLKLQLVGAYFAGFIGGYLLARRLGMSFYAAFIPPAVYMLSSYFALHAAAGHIPFHYFAAFPWLILAYKKSLGRPVHILSIGAVTALMILGNGGAVPFLFALFFLLLISLFDIGGGRGLRPPLYVMAGGGAGLLFAAVKFLPMLDYLLRNPWVPPGTVMTTPLSFLPTMMFRFNQSLFSDYAAGYVYGWHEYGAFVGPLAVILAAVGLCFRFKTEWRYLVLALISLILVLGSFAPPWSPWDLIHRLPGFSSLRVPSRFILLAIFSLSILAGRGTDLLIPLIRFRRIFTAVIFAGLAGLSLMVSLPILNEAFTRSPETVSPQPEFAQVPGDPNRMYAAFLENRGTMNAAWISGYQGSRGIYDGERFHEWYAPQGPVNVLRRDFTPNRISFSLDSPIGGRLLVGQGYDPGWRRTDGGSIEEFEGLVSFRVFPGKSAVEIYYRPPYFFAGLCVSILSIILALAGIGWYRWRAKSGISAASI